MYNIFQARKQSNKLERLTHNLKEEAAWLKNYRTSTQPNLLSKYNKRISNFIRKIQEHPIRLRGVEPTIDPNKIFRGKSLNEKPFVYKDFKGWKKLPTLSKNQLNKQHISAEHQNLRPQQNIYTDCKQHNFRSRIKEKEINPPMKYTYKVTVALEKSREKLYRSKKKSAQDAKKGKKSRKQESKEDSLGPKRKTSFNSLRESCFNTTNSGQSSMNGQENQQKEKEDKAIKRLHLKRILDIEQNCCDPGQKRKMRELLIKIGIIRKKGKRDYQPEESEDDFDFLVR